MSRAPLIHRIPIRDFDIELRLPRDLTAEEAVRIGKLVRTDRARSMECVRKMAIAIDRI